MNEIMERLFLSWEEIMVRESKCLGDQNAWIKIAEESLGLDEKLLWKRN